MYVLNAEDFKRAKITLGLIIVNVIFFFGVTTLPSSAIFYLLAQVNQPILTNLEIWRLFTAMFLHFDPLHLFSNMLALLIFGSALETSKYYTKWHYLFIYFVSGVMGNIASLFLLPPSTLSAGASGAVFGVIAAMFLVIATENPSLLVFALVYMAYFIISSFAEGVNLWAHLFGIAGGLLFGYLFKRKHISIEYY